MEKTVDLKKKMRVIEGFPGPGISYKDITTILSDPDALQAMVQQLADAADGLILIMCWGRNRVDLSWACL